MVPTAVAYNFALPGSANTAKRLIECRASMLSSTFAGTEALTIFFTSIRSAAGIKPTGAANSIFVATYEK